LKFTRIAAILAAHSPASLLKVKLHRESRCPIVAFLAVLVGIVAPLKAAVISGSIFDVESGKGIENATVKVLPGGLGVAAGVDGSYLLRDIPAGEWQLEVTHIGYEAARSRFTVYSEHDTLLEVLSLKPLVIPLSEFVFTATRTLKTLKSVPVATELITRQDFERRGAVTVAEALETEIGYDVSKDFSGAGVMLQGVDADKVLILIDGNRVIGRVNGSIDLDQVSVTNVRQIEVVKGSVSTLYGSEAIGGVINIVTDRPAEQLQIRSSSLTSGFLPDGEGFRPGSLAGSSSLSISSSSGHWSYSAGGRYSAAGLIDITPESPHTTGSPELGRGNADLKLIYTIDDFTFLSTSVRGVLERKDWVEDSGQSSIDLAFDDSETNQTYDYSFEVLRTPHRDERLSLKIYHSQNHHDWEKRTQKIWGPPRVIDYSRGDESFGEISTQLTRMFWESHLVTLGGDIYNWDIASDSKVGEVTSPFSGNLTAGSAFAQDEWQYSPQLVFVPGIRFEDHEIYGLNVSPRLSAMYSLNDDTRLRAAVGIGYRAPSSKELFYTFNHSAAGYIVYGNPALEPEKSQNYSLGFEHNYRNSSVARVTIFLNRMKNLIDFYQTGATDEFYLGTYQYQNIYSAWIRGFEIERGFQLEPSFELKLAYSYMESHNGLTGGQLLRRPQHSARWDLTYKRSAWTGKIWGKSTSRSMFTDIFNTPSQISDEWTIPYEVWNVSVSREWGKDFSVFAKIENALNKVHGRYGPYEGRTIAFGLNCELHHDRK